MGSLRSTCRFIGRILFRKFCCCASVILIFLPAVPATSGQSSAKSEGTKSVRESLQQHYDAARTFQISGEQEQAAKEYKAFLAEALRRIGDANTNAEKFEDASRLFAE